MKLLRERQERMILIESSASAMEITESESDVQCTPDKFDLAGYNRYNLDADIYFPIIGSLEITSSLPENLENSFDISNHHG